MVRGVRTEREKWVALGFLAGAEAMPVRNVNPG
jgi:hypothetical protein